VFAGNTQVGWSALRCTTFHTEPGEHPTCSFLSLSPDNSL